MKTAGIRRAWPWLAGHYPERGPAKLRSEDREGGWEQCLNQQACLEVD